MNFFGRGEGDSRVWSNFLGGEGKGGGVSPGSKVQSSFWVCRLALSLRTADVLPVVDRKYVCCSGYKLALALNNIVIAPS